jgi:hypothetical protein
MLSQISRRTIALAIQLAGVVLLAATSIMGLQRDTVLLQMGALIFVVGCYLEARAQRRSSENTETPIGINEPTYPRVPRLSLILDIAGRHDTAVDCRPGGVIGWCC